MAASAPHLNIEIGGAGEEVRHSQRFIAELAKFLPSPVTLRRHMCTNYNNGDGHGDGHGDSRDNSHETRKRTARI